MFLKNAALAENVDVRKNIETFGCDLSLIEFPEWQRTKHVHRLHPYLGKFIPQLVELFLRRFFEPGDTILDPFAGSGTTLVEANALGMNALGIELSPFNCLIIEAKTRRHDLAAIRREVTDAFRRVEVFSRQEDGLLPLLPKPGAFGTASSYLNDWIAPQALQQILFYRSISPEYRNQDLLKVILSRTARSVRLIPHYDLARPKKPLKPGEQYHCVKHNRTCEPITDGLKFFRRYSRDTVSRIEEFDRLRSHRPEACATVLKGDARTTPLPDGVRLDGVFTSPPYVGMIDYHEQHRYAYELFPELERRDASEIGPMSLGKSKKAQRAYQADIAAVFRNLRPWLKPTAKLFVVANDTHGLYPAIGEMAELKLVDTFHRPVPMRTERDVKTYFESIFWFELA
ncbi:MAG: site-specific DNA-methyltransferase [Planctomycetes bacterium]|nr:site-specific DNA-methyltransferase [Planctomycetota bacterium]